MPRRKPEKICVAVVCRTAAAAHFPAGDRAARIIVNAHVVADLHAVTKNAANLVVLADEHVINQGVCIVRNHGTHVTIDLGQLQEFHSYGCANVVYDSPIGIGYDQSITTHHLTARRTETEK